MNRDGDDPPPTNTIIRAISQCRNKKLLIEANTSTAADWIKLNATRIFKPLIGHPVKTLGRHHPVIARFMPILFQTDEAGTRDLESSANLPENSISQVTWIKNPERRAAGQQVANLKIICNSAETANSLIMGSGRISHLGSQIQFHKDIKAPGTCSKCQEYGHSATNCKSENPACAKCGETHQTSECQTRTTKCTPCGSKKHQTNDVKCPERIAREEAILTKKPELLTPYYITAERWTWGLPSATPTVTSEDAAHQHHRIFKNGNRQRHYDRGHPRRQRTLFNTGFQHGPMITGANNIPINPKKSSNDRPPSPTHTQVRSPSPQRTNTVDSAMMPQPETTPQ